MANIQDFKVSSGLSVEANANIIGITTSSSFSGNGANLTGIFVDIENVRGLDVSSANTGDTLVYDSSTQSWSAQIPLAADPTLPIEMAIALG